MTGWYDDKRREIGFSMMQLCSLLPVGVATTYSVLEILSKREGGGGGGGGGSELPFRPLFAWRLREAVKML